MNTNNQIGGQNRLEFLEFINWLRDKNIESYLEVGAREGIALKYLCKELGVKRVTAVDLPNGPWGRANTDGKLVKNLDSLNVPYNLYLGDSTDPLIIKAVSRERFDLVFIDGDHSYEGVKADYENYSPLGRIVALHDVNQREGAKAYGPTQLFNEIGGHKIAHSKKGIGICSPST